MLSKFYTFALSVLLLRLVLSFTEEKTPLSRKETLSRFSMLSFYNTQRKDYEEFLVDRVRTVQCLRAVGGNDKALDSNLYCIRGLEPFHSTEIHEEFHSKRHFHQSTIIVEQVRQSMLDIP